MISRRGPDTNQRSEGAAQPMPTSSYHNDEPTPDIDGRWLCITTAADRLLARLCSIDDVICELEEAMRGGRLPCRAQSCTSGRRLVDKSEWDANQLVVLNSPDSWIIAAAHRETGEPLPVSLCIWEPNYDRLWSANAQPVPACIAPAPIDPPLPELAPLTLAQRRRKVRIEATEWLMQIPKSKLCGREYHKKPCMDHFAKYDPPLSAAEYYEAAKAAGCLFKRGARRTY